MMKKPGTFAGCFAYEAHKAYSYLYRDLCKTIITEHRFSDGAALDTDAFINLHAVQYIHCTQQGFVGG
jgi:hypothetical protein